LQASPPAARALTRL